MKTRFVICNSKSGKFYKGNGKWTKTLDPMNSLIFESKKEAQTWVDDPLYIGLAPARKHCKVVAVKLVVCK